MEFPNSPANGGTGSQLPQQTTVTRKVLTVGFGGTNLADITVKRDPVTVNHGQPASTVARFIVPSCSMNSFLGQRPTIRSSGTIFTVPANISQPKPPQLAGSQQTFIVSPQVFRPGLNSHPSAGDSSGASTSGNTVVVAVSSSGGLTDIKHGGPSFFKSAPGVSYHPTTSRVVVSPSQAGGGTRTVGFQASVNAPPGRVHLLPVDASEPQSDGNQNPYRSMQRGHFPINVSTYEDHHASSSGNNAGFKLRPGGSFEPDYHERIVKAAGGYSVIPPPIYAHHSSAFAMRRLNSKSNALARRPCSCNRSMCLKLYCDCFANGEFCRNCNCTNCHNNLAFESDRTKAIKGVLDRNPRAFHPKVAGKGYMTEKKHYKGCNCKKSACLKNYCECYEAKVTCGIRCKCLGCRNTDVKRHAVRQSTAKSLMHLASVAEAARHVDQLRKDAQASVTPPYNQPHPQATPGMVSVAPSTSSQPSSSQGEPGTSSSTMSSMHGTASPFPNVSMAQAERELTAETPWSLLRDDIVESTAHCLLATVHDLEQGAFPPGAVNPGLNTTVGSPMLGEAASAAPLSSSVLVEKAIIKEFGRCLRTLMETAADMRADALLTLEEMGSAEGIVPPQEAPRPPGTARPAPTTGAILLPSVQARLRRETEQRQQERAEMIRERSAVATNHDGGREDEQEEPDDVEYQYERDDEDDDDEVETEEQP